MIKVCRPFWSYDVIKTEEWLSAMAKKGYHLVKINRWTRCFFFRLGEPRSIMYQLVYEKNPVGSLSGSLVNEGWEKVYLSGNWLIMSNERPPEQIRISSVRDGIIKRNRTHFYIFSFGLMYLAGMAMVNLTMIGFTLTQDGSVRVEESPLWVVTYLFWGVLIATLGLSVYSVITLYRTNKRLLNEKRFFSPYKEENEEKNEEQRRKEKARELKRSGQLIVKRRFGWMYSPDKLEMWLENMEKQGFHLNRVNKLGTTFYFTLGSPRHVRYAADYQHISDESYFEIHKEAGWKPVFVSMGSLQKWTLWSQEYSEAEEKPHFYSDKTNHLKQARRVAIAYSILFLPLLVIYSLNLSFYIEDLFSYTRTWRSVTPFLLLLCIFMFGLFTVRTWMYYIRLKKRD